MTHLKVDLINRALCVSQGRSEAMAQGCIQDPRFPHWPDIQAREALMLESPLLSSSSVPPLVWEAASWVREPMSSCPYCGHCSISQVSSTQGLAMVTQKMVEGDCWRGCLKFRSASWATHVCGQIMGGGEKMGCEPWLALTGSPALVMLWFYWLWSCIGQAVG